MSQMQSCSNQSVSVFVGIEGNSIQIGCEPAKHVITCRLFRQGSYESYRDESTCQYLMQQLKTSGKQNL